MILALSHWLESLSKQVMKSPLHRALCWSSYNSFSTTTFPACSAWSETWMSGWGRRRSSGSSIFCSWSEGSSIAYAPSPGLSYASCGCCLPPALVTPSLGLSPKTAPPASLMSLQIGTLVEDLSVSSVFSSGRLARDSLSSSASCSSGSAWAASLTYS